MRVGYERVSEEGEGNGADANRQCPPPGIGAGHGGANYIDFYGPDIARGSRSRGLLGRARARAIRPKSPELGMAQPAPVDTLWSELEKQNEQNFVKMAISGWKLMEESVQLAKVQSVKDLETPKAQSQQPSTNVSSVYAATEEEPHTSSNAYWEPETGISKRSGPQKRLEVRETGGTAGALGGGDLTIKTDESDEWDKPLGEQKALMSGVLLGSPKIFLGTGLQKCDHQFQTKVCLCHTVRGEICVKCFILKCNRTCNIGGPSLSNADFSRMYSTSTNKSE